MCPVLRFSRRFAAAVALLTPLALPPPAAAVPPPRLDRIIVVVMENKTYDQVRTQPYTASLIANGSSFSSSFAVTHPSQPNYIALWAGNTLGVTNDICPAPGSPFVVENLGHACEAAGLTWKAYSENLPSAGSSVCTASGTLYTRKHDPWTNFSNLNHLNERPYADLAVDEAAGTLPNLSFVIPNNCNNSHDSGCTVALADSWLAANVPAMLGSLGPNGMLVLTWDEDNGTAGNHILTVFVGPRVKPGFVSPTTIHHYVVLKTLCETLGLTPIALAASQPSIADVWLSDTTPPTVTVTAPNGGETWKVGSTHLVTWIATDHTGVASVDITLSTDGGLSDSYAIANGIANTGSFAWTVPDAPTSSARVRVTAHDPAGNAGADASDADFTIDRWVILSSAGPNGTIAPQGTIELAQGASQGFAIMPDPCYHIADVQVDGGSVGAVSSYTFTDVISDHSILASFAIDTYTLTTSAGLHGSVAPAGVTAVDCGSDVKIAIVPDAGYRVSVVSVDGEQVPATASYVLGNVHDHHTLQALFELDNHDPDCSWVLGMITEIWPPDHKLTPVSIANVTDADGDSVTLTVTGITQDEPLNSRGDGNTCPDGAIVDGAAQVRMERGGNAAAPGNGRIYVVSFTATDGRGGHCEGEIRVCVPRDQELGHSCYDDGQTVNSLGPCARGNSIDLESVASENGLWIVGRDGGSTILEYALAADSDVSLAVYDVGGRQMATLEHGWQTAGTHRTAWRISNVSPGLYFARFVAGESAMTRTVLVTR